MVKLILRVVKVYSRTSILSTTTPDVRFLYIKYITLIDITDTPDMFPFKQFAIYRYSES